MDREQELAAIDAWIARHENDHRRISKTPPGHTEAWTDGSCRGNPGPGGYAAILICDGHQREISAGMPETTNNRMELMGVIAALEALKRPTSIKIYTDSRYVLDGATKWMEGWKRRNWRGKTTSGPIKNVDLWRRLDDAMKPHHVTWQWVRGHVGYPLNERADQLAQAAARKL